MINPIQALTLRQLKLITVLADVGSVHIAASLMDITQSTATKALQKTEDVLSVTLFDRTSRGLLLTAEGKIFVQSARTILQELENTIAKLNKINSGSLGQIQIGVPKAASRAALQDAIILNRKASPDIGITVKEGANAELLLRLMEQELDIVVGRKWIGIDDMPGVKFTKLYTETSCLCVHPEHPILKLENLNLASLVNEHWILPPSEMVLRTRIEESFSDLGLPLPSRYVESTGFNGNLNLVRGTDIIAVWPYQAIRNEYKSGRIAILPITLPRTINEIGISIAVNRKPSLPLKNFIEHLHQVGSCFRKHETDWQS